MVRTDETADPTHATIFHNKPRSTPLRQLRKRIVSKP